MFDLIELAPELYRLVNFLFPWFMACSGFTLPKSNWALPQGNLPCRSTLEVIYCGSTAIPAMAAPEQVDLE